MIAYANTPEFISQKQLSLDRPVQRRDVVRLIDDDELKLHAGDPPPREHLMDKARDCPGVLVDPGATTRRAEHDVRDAASVHVRHDPLEGIRLPRPGVPDHRAPPLEESFYRGTAVLISLEEDVPAFSLHIRTTDRSPGQPPPRG